MGNANPPNVEQSSGFQTCLVSVVMLLYKGKNGDLKSPNNNLRPHPRVTERQTASNCIVPYSLPIP